MSEGIQAWGVTGGIQAEGPQKYDSRIPETILRLLKCLPDQAGHYSAYGAYYYVHTGEAYNFHQEYLERVEKLLGDEDDVQLQPYHYKPWFLCMGDLSEDENNEANRSLAIWYDKDSVTLISED